MARKLVSAGPATPATKTSSLSGLVQALTDSTDAARMAKVTKMLRAERFQLFSAITDEHISGVVKSQTDARLVYACRLTADGSYYCCTQNLMVCGGLRGALCKHLLVLVIGSVQGGALDAAAAGTWAGASRRRPPKLDKDSATATFVRYKGAEAGEIDWRPTETIPEDYYAL